MDEVVEERKKRKGKKREDKQILLGKARLEGTNAWASSIASSHTNILTETARNRQKKPRGWPPGQMSCDCRLNDFN